MKKAHILSITVVTLMASLASAENIRGINMDFVTIGNAGNPLDTVIVNSHSGAGGWVTGGAVNCGAVNYEYRIGKYEVTNAQWNAFIATSGVPTGNPSTAYDESSYYLGNQQPVNRISWYEASQFCNYLTSGDKSKGAYQFSGSNSNPGDFLGIDRSAARASYSVVYVLPTEDEWYKAAYYKSDGSGYSLYANGQNSIPAPDNGWNSYRGSYSAPWNVGTGYIEQNGTFDMMGNIIEWVETPFSGSTGILRGGSFDSWATDLASSLRAVRPIQVEDYLSVGFRIASIPEPTTLSLIGLGGLLLRRKR